MTKKTAEKVADTLGLAEALLSLSHRPRKRPGKPRPEALTMKGEEVTVTKTNFWHLNKVSLVGALKLARYEQGYSKRIFDLAAEQLANYTEHWVLFYNESDTVKGIRAVDDAEFDTRQIVRDIRAARKSIEQTYELV